MATGCLSTANFPSLPGQEKFAGRILHSGRWPHEVVDFRGKCVGVVGTGSSAIQMIPILAEVTGRPEADFRVQQHIGQPSSAEPVSDEDWNTAVDRFAAAHPELFEY